MITRRLTTKENAFLYLNLILLTVYWERERERGEQEIKRELFKKVMFYRYQRGELLSDKLYI